jgi:hypothetical protein
MISSATLLAWARECDQSRFDDTTAEQAATYEQAAALFRAAATFARLAEEAHAAAECSDLLALKMMATIRELRSERTAAKPMA